MKMYVETKKGTKSEKPYTALYVDLGYKQLSVTFDKNIIAELADVTLRKVESMQVGDKIEIGEIVL